MSIVCSLRELAALPDPIGNVLESWTRPNGLEITKVRVPIGVIGLIYEARPNVTVDSSAICVKTGNCVLLRGSRSCLTTNRALTEVIQQALETVGLPKGAVQLLESPDLAATTDMMHAHGLIDVLIPRGGASLINHVRTNARIPVIETGAGNCHLFIHEDADPTMATAIALNAKTSRPSVCNAIETLLIHHEWPESYSTALLAALHEAGVALRGCPKTLELCPLATLATATDYETEYNDLILAVRFVASLDEALHHIETHGTRHSEAIVTTSLSVAARFLEEVDATTVYHNASTRFTDGGEFGFGAEIGISTQKLHARGPMGLPELCSYKYLVRGTGQVR
jgi:glutamate-5-semialdehyde dehydrogenase